jgi:hypothetical protein
MRLNSRISQIDEIEEEDIEDGMGSSKLLKMKQENIEEGLFSVK